MGIPFFAKPSNGCLLAGLMNDHIQPGSLSNKNLVDFISDLNIPPLFAVSGRSALHLLYP